MRRLSIKIVVVLIVALVYEACIMTFKQLEICSDITTSSKNEDRLLGCAAVKWHDRQLPKTDACQHALLDCPSGLVGECA